MAAESPKIRLHIPGIPHTITRGEFSHCAFTGKVLRFSPMMRARGFEVYHYGVETSESGADVDVQLMTKAEWADLRVQSYMFLKKVAREEAERVLSDPTAFVGELANWDTPLYKVFNERLATALRSSYRSKATDIFCMPLFKYHAIDHVSMLVVEHGIGYPNSGTAFRIFESYAWMHAHLAKGNGNNYWFVVPNYFDSRDWVPSPSPSLAPPTVGFLGRIYDGKGCGEIVEMARRFPAVRFVLCGQGDPTKYLVVPNIVYKPPIHGTERAEYLGSLVASVAPTMFVEPFCGVAVESQLCGTPVMTKDYGAQTETVEQFKTGVRCHTLADYCLGIQMALDGKFDRAYIRERAVRLYDLEPVGRQFEYCFKSILDIFNGKNGWYSPDSHLVADGASTSEARAGAEVAEPK
jgi:glycosyltransferase involved in cell wall biosynthesis